MKKTALIIGGNGLIGKCLTQQALESTEYDKVRLLIRKPMTIRHPKLEQFLYDFENPKPELIQADHVFCCLGTTIKKAGSQEKFYRIDHDYVYETAQFAKSKGAKLFSLVSSIGADPKSRVFYSRVKGELEENLKQLNYDRLQIFQPSILLGARQENRFGEKIAQVLMKGLSFLVPPNYRGIEGEKVAFAMLKNAISNTDKIQLFSNRDMLKFYTDEK